MPKYHFASFPLFFFFSALLCFNIWDLWLVNCTRNAVSLNFGRDFIALGCFLQEDKTFVKGAVTKRRIEGKRKMRHLKPLKANFHSSRLCRVLNLVCVLADSELQMGTKHWLELAGELWRTAEADAVLSWPPCLYSCIAAMWCSVGFNLSWHRSTSVSPSEPPWRDSTGSWSSNCF